MTFMAEFAMHMNNYHKYTLSSDLREMRIYDLQNHELGDITP